MSTLGVFLGLAGGFAVAKITGDGSVRSGSVRNLGSEYKTVVRVPELGAVQAACINGDETMVAWTSLDRPTRVSVKRDDGSLSFQHQRGSRSGYEIGLGGIGTRIQFHVAPRFGKDEPQTVASVFGNDFSGPCAAQVSAIAVGTEK
jgi:hypothetical protein